MGVFGYEKKTLDEVALVEMMTIDGVIKARKAIIKKLIKTVKITEILHYCYKNITKVLHNFYKSGIIDMYKGNFVR